jgi:hypothetical protein
LNASVNCLLPPIQFQPDLSGGFPGGEHFLKKLLLGQRPSSHRGSHVSCLLIKSTNGKPTTYRFATSAQSRENRPVVHLRGRDERATELAH